MSSASFTPSPTLPSPVHHKKQLSNDQTTVVGTEPIAKAPDLEKALQDKAQRKRGPLTERNRCVRYMCCACCLPVWARWIVWFVIISIVICVVVIGSLLGSFSMPTIALAGVAPSPDPSSSQIGYNGATFNINFGLLVHIQNPNVLPIHLSNINVTAYYPLSDDGTKRTYMGGGFIDSMVVPKNSNYNFTFPFTMKYNPLNTNNQLLLNGILEKCGMTGDEPQDISVDYNVQVTARVLFVTVHPPISSTATFGCPLNQLTSE